MFKKIKENFICEKCGTQNIGTGYTNHCFRCLYSKHVDKDPGDRLEACGGLMKPVSKRLKEGEWQVKQECQACRFTRNQTLSEEDSIDALILIKENF